MPDVPPDTSKAGKGYDALATVRNLKGFKVRFKKVTAITSYLTNNCRISNSYEPRRHSTLLLDLKKLLDCYRNKGGVYYMSEKAERVLNTFEKIIPNLTELQKEKLISYGEGYAEGIRTSEIKSSEPAVESVQCVS